MDDGSHVHLFTTQVGKDRNVVHFPMLEGVLASLQQGRDRFLYPLLISLLALLLSVLGYFRSAG